jgi:tRNA pseudouridine38-40 synthase
LCDLHEARWERHDYKLVFHIRANRFLRNMVRAVVGTLLEVGRGKMDLAEFKAIIEGGKRTQAGQTAPAQGLHLTHIVYPADKIQSIE